MNEAMQSKPEGYYEALYDLQAIDFTLVELTLYLDTHPVDTQALGQYNQLAKQSQEMKHRFEERFGPITHRSVSATAPFGWTVTPWPWEV